MQRLPFQLKDTVVRYLLSALFLLIFLQGCQTVDEYKEPTATGSAVATLTGTSRRDGLTHWTQFAVEEIDQKPISLFQTGTSAEFKVTPGQHKVLVLSAFNRGWGGYCPCESRHIVTGNFSAGNAYRVNGEVVDNRTRVWIENATTGKVVSNVDEEAYTSYGY